MLTLIIFFLIMSTIFSYFFSNFFGRKGVFFLSTGLTFLSVITITFFFINFEEIIVYDFFRWISALSFDIYWSFTLNNLTTVMSFIVLIISFFVHLYSIFYMVNDLNSSKFMSYLSLFTLFMIFLVCSSNFLVLFFGWEGVGLCSFLLISFWNTRIQANKAALKAMIINRIGDFFFLIAIVAIFVTFKSLDFSVVFSLSFVYKYKLIFYNFSIIDFVCLLLLLSAFVKSAQIFFHGWLPDATEGPTPVSALIHSATMVTAGVFLVIRCSYLFELSGLCLTLLIYFGSITLFVFSIVSFFQNDIKKIIAYSTCSQLGYMILGCGLSAYNFSFFHLFNHAFFKALLFLISGYLIHLTGNEQDVRKMNGLFNIAPLPITMFIIGSLSLIGFPFFSGFYSKEPIILISYFYKNHVIFLSTIVGVFFTLLYSLKIIYFLVLKKNYNIKNYLKVFKIYKFDVFAFFPLICLTFFSVFSGILFKNIFIINGNNFFSGTILSIVNENIKFYEFLPIYIKLIPFFVMIFAFYSFFLFQKNFNFENNFLYITYVFFNKAMFVDSLLNIFITQNIYNLSYKFFISFDKGFLEHYGPWCILSILYRSYFFISKNFITLNTLFCFYLIAIGFLNFLLLILLLQV